MELESDDSNDTLKTISLGLLLLKDNQIHDSKTITVSSLFFNYWENSTENGGIVLMFYYFYDTSHIIRRRYTILGF